MHREKIENKFILLLLKGFLRVSVVRLQDLGTIKLLYVAHRMFENKNMVEMHDEEFLLIRDFIYDHCGLFFETDSKYLLEKRLSGRIALHQISSYRDYYLYLKYDRLRDEELSTVLDLLTTNETYFFQGRVSTEGLY